jgi:hypothetical protein
MIKRISVWSALGVMVAAVAAAAVVPTSSAQRTPGLNVACANASCLGQNITGTVNGVAYDLTATVDRFVHRRVTLGAVTTASGTANGVPIDPVTQQVPLAGAVADPCTILDLTLGPLHLDLLGLVVDLNQLHLTSPARQARATCSAASNALNNGGASGLANRLNRLLGL